MAGGKRKIERRRAQILEHLRTNEKVTVAKLSDALAVTEATIRNDLSVLEKEGVLLRVQGGARRIPGAALQTEQPVQKDPVEEQKRTIGIAVAALVHDGDTLFINSGTTSEHIAKALSCRRNLNIVTNSLGVATVLGVVPSFRVLLAGGEINAQYGFTHGGDVQEQLGKYKADWAILSVDGISAKGGVTTHHAEEAIIDRIMSNGAKQTVIAADVRKIGRTGFSRVCESKENLLLVTNPGGDLETLEGLKECGVTVVIAQQ